MQQCLSPSTVSSGKTTYNKKILENIPPVSLLSLRSLLHLSSCHQRFTSVRVHTQCSWYLTSQTGFNLNHEEAGNPHNCWPDFEDGHMGQDDRQIKINHLFKLVAHVSFLTVYLACFCFWKWAVCNSTDLLLFIQSHWKENLRTSRLQSRKIMNFVLNRKCLCTWKWN